MLGRDGEAASTDVIWTCYGQIDVAAATHVDKPGQRGFARDDGQIAQSFCHVGHLVARLNVDRDVGMLFDEGTDDRHESTGGKARGRGETNASRKRLMIVAKGLQQAVVRTKNRFDAFEGHFACIGELQRARIVSNQFAPERLFQSGNRS